MADTLTLELHSPQILEQPVVASDRTDAPLKPLPKEGFPRQLAESLCERLPWSELPEAEHRRGNVLQAYNRSLDFLNACRQEVRALLSFTCQANLEFRQQRGQTNVSARDRTVKSQLKQMLDQAAWTQKPPRSILTGPVISKKVVLLRQQLEADLAKLVQQFVEDFRQLLIRLEERHLVGQVQWYEEQCCGYDFFKRVVIQENDGGSVQVKQVFNDSSADLRQIGEEVKTVVHGKGRHIHLSEWHEHTVYDAVRTTIRESRVVMPPAVVELVNHVPEWLYPFVQVIDGDICTEAIQNFGQAKREDWKEVEVERRPIYGCEPAVIIGPYVLSGWGPREVEAELKRREAVAQEEANQKRLQAPSQAMPLFQALVAGFSGLLAVWPLTQAQVGFGGALVMFFSAALSLGMTWVLAYDKEVHRGRKHAKAAASYWTSIAAGCLVTLAGLLLWWSFPRLAILLPIPLIVMALSLLRIDRLK